MELQNYRKFRKAAIEFPDGVIGIIGPNGVGKTTLIEAISWALYGNDAQRTRKEDVRWMGAPRDSSCSVVLEFDLGDDTYLVRREMRGAELKMMVSLKVNGKLQANGDRAVTRFLSNRLGMDYKAFFISVFARQKDLDALSVLPPSERRQLILRMLDIDALDRIISSIRSDRSSTQSQIEGLSRILVDERGRDKIASIDEDIASIEESFEGQNVRAQTLRETIERMDGEASDLKEQITVLASKEKEYNGIHRDLAGKRSSLEGRKKAIASLETERESLEKLRGEMDDLKEKSELLDRLTAQREEMERARSVYEERASLQTRLDSLIEEITPLEEKIDGYKKTISEMGDPASRLKTVSSSMKEVDESIAELRDRATELNGELRSKSNEMEEATSRRKEVVELGPESSCPTCERRLGDQYQFLLDKLSKEIEESEGALLTIKDEREEKQALLDREKKRRKVLEERLDDLRNDQIRIAQLTESLSGHENRLEEIRAEIETLETRIREIEDVEFNEEEYRRIGSRIKELKTPARRYSEIRGKMERLPHILQEEKETQGEIDDLRSAIGGLESRLESLQFDGGRLTSLRERYDKLIETREQTSNSMSDLRSEIRVLEGRKESLMGERNALEENRKRRDERELEMSELSALGEVMLDFRSNLISRIVPTLSDISSELFNEMTGSRYGGMEVDKEYNVSVFDGGEIYGLERFSGGERDLANLCLRLAISRVIADRSGSSVDFLILDEIFGSQDQNRKRTVLSTLNRLSRKFRQIILITHIDDVKDSMENVVYVKELEDGSSELVV